MEKRDKGNAYLKNSLHIKINNVVGSSYITNKNCYEYENGNYLKEAAKTIPNSIIKNKNKNLPGIIIELLKPSAKVSIYFPSHSIIVCGCTSLDYLDTIINIIKRKFNVRLRNLNLPLLQITRPKITSITSCFQYHTRIYLENLSLMASNFFDESTKIKIDYDSCLFPGVFLKFQGHTKINGKKAGPAVIIFANGKILITGSKSRQDIIKLIQILFPLLKRNENNELIKYQSTTPTTKSNKKNVRTTNIIHNNNNNNNFKSQEVIDENNNINIDFEKLLNSTNNNINFKSNTLFNVNSIRK